MRHDDVMEFLSDRQAAYLLFYKLLVPDPNDHNAYVSLVEPWPSGGYSLTLDHGVFLTDEEAEVVREIQNKRDAATPDARAQNDGLSAVDAANARSLLTGVTTSAVKQTWGCGHSIHSVNGDALYAACPICYAQKTE